MTHADHVLATPRCAAFAERHLSRRPLHIISDRTALASFLFSTCARSVTFCGAWEQLTVGVSRALAEWAREDSDRGCGLYLADPQIAESAADSAVGLAGSSVDAQILEIGDSDQAMVHARDGRRAVRPDELIARLLDEEAPVPAGLALTGHGAEYCIRFGSRWLSTIETAMLGEDVVRPARKLASAVLLNGCSSLRLGDSCVPEQFSLARALYTRGSAVIGSFRNLHTSPLHGHLFADAVLAGYSLGRVVNQLNIQAQALGARHAQFQLLGDATVSILPGAAAARIFQLPACVHRAAPASLEGVIDEAAWLDAVIASVARWMPTTREAQDAHARLVRSVNLAGRAVHAWHLIGLGRAEVRLVVEVVARELDLSRTALLIELARFIRHETWIQAAYGPQSRRTDTSEAVCERCGELSVWTRYQPFASHLLPVYRGECDRCGTLGERIGDAEVPGAIAIYPARERFDLTLPPLAERGHGIIFFHRMPEFPPRPWPAQGGEMSIPHAELSFRGRLTLVAAAIGARSLTIQYHTVFVDPVCQSATSST